LSIIGHGTFGKVYLVRQKKKKTLHAMKCIRKDVVIEHESVQSLAVEKLILL
jgi:serine/threonine protein kinase